MTTLKDLSRHLGLSITQVSRALNDHNDVSPDTKQRVREAASALKYQPNVMARRLVTGRSGIVGLIYPGVPDSSDSLQFAHFVRGLCSNFTRLGRQFMLHVADDEKAELDVYDRLIRSRSIDGFVILLPGASDARVDFLRERQICFALHGQTMDAPDYPFYDIDNVAVGYDLTSHLIRHGHQNIAIFNGQTTAAFAQRRYQGYARALQDAGLPVRPEFQAGSVMTAEFGLLETVRMFQSDGPKPTAIIAGNMRIAQGIFDATRALGLRVPDDISLVVHDDGLPEVARGSLPVPITATVAPFHEAWSAVAEILDGALKGAPLEDIQIVQSHSFEEGRSVRRLAPPVGPKSADR